MARACCGTYVDATSFEIKVDKAQLQTLHSRLDDITWPTELADVDSHNWKYGAPVGVIRELVSYLKSDYNYSEQVEKLNELPHFTAKVSEYDIHFIHQKSSNKDASPLMFVHGEPIML